MSTSFFAVVAPGLEAVALAELAECGLVAARLEEGGVAFEGPLEHAWRANLWSRVATRVLARVATFPARAFGALEDGVAAVDWRPYLRPGTPVDVRAATHGARLRHAGHVAQAVTRALQRHAGTRPGADEDATQQVLVRIVGDNATLSLDTSGALLHRRGWRPVAGAAPIRETLAAGLLRLAGWTPEEALVDPMCGAGTFVVEAALAALRVPPGRDRAFAFERWPSFERARFDALLAAADATRRAALPHPVLGADADARVVEVARANAERAGVSTQVALLHRPVGLLAPPEGARGLVVCNPPYGLRLGSRSTAKSSYRELGAVLSTRFRGWRAAILSPDRRLERELRLLVTKRTPLENGGRPIELVLAAL